MEALGISLKRQDSPAGRDFLDETPREDRDSLQAMLQRVREQGKAPGIVIHFGKECKAWLARASVLTAEAGQVFLVQLCPVGAQPPFFAEPDAPSVEDLIERLPDGFVVINREGVIRRANQTFLDMVEVGAKSSVLGERLGRWLWRPGADLAVLLATVQRHGYVRLFSTGLRGELGSEIEVEILASGSGEDDGRHIALLLRDVTRRLQPVADANRLMTALGPIAEQIGKTSLRKLVGDTVEIVERHYVRAALDLAGGNRTAAAGLLGLSRQSLYAKLNRYDIGDTPQTASKN